ncbi:MAG: ABC transporter C-terminal domain-containing protein, partial [Cyclobacteriaceae bacterium]
KEIDLLEEKILKLEQEVDKLEKELADPETFSDTDKAEKINNRYQSKNSELDRVNEQWEKLVDKV